MEILSKDEQVQLFKKMQESILSEIKDLKDQIAFYKSESPKLNRAEAAKKLGISWHHLKQISYDQDAEKADDVLNKRIPYKKVGKNFLYDLEDLLTYELKKKGD